ncbi:MAG: phosphatidylserine decarboxylase [Treponema sp.]|jgi:phosphatidylserine decarboxylase|nr:phosphatidylserine decarboxylase [Treponema sp.]
MKKGREPVSVLKEGYPFIFPPLAAGLGLVIIPRLAGLEAAVFYYILPALGIVLVFFALFCLFFFRDPAITISTGENHVLSPCNGTVIEVRKEENETIIRIFLSVFNVHLQRSPVKGKLTNLEYKKGRFLMAFNPLAHSLNEQNIFTIENEHGRFTVSQVAGFLARRCVSWVKTGDQLKQGDKIGCIKFGSQVDICLPKSVGTALRSGETVRAGITIIGEIP